MKVLRTIHTQFHVCIVYNGYQQQIRVYGIPIISD